MALARDVSVCCHGTKGDTMANAARKLVDFDTVHDFLTDLFDADIHARRVYSLANATLGVMSSASLAVHTIGQALAQARGLTPKHAVKQVDRLLSNGGLQVWALFEHWVPYVVSARSERWRWTGRTLPTTIRPPSRCTW